MEITWVEVGNGRLALGHRPKLKKMRDLKKAGVSYVLTLLAEREGATQIGEAVENWGMKWIHVPFGSGDSEKANVEDARALFGLLKDVLEFNHNIYIHCSAGIHRTGMIANAFLRYLGATAEEAKEILAKLRQHTAEGVGEHRLAWGEQFAESV